MDLTKRLLKYSCSYLLYSEAFAGLPADLRNAVYRRLFEILSGRAPSATYAHLSAADRRAISEILRATLGGPTAH